MTIKIVIALILNFDRSSKTFLFNELENMKKALATTLSVVVLSIAILTISAGTVFNPKKDKVNIQGTWQLVSYKYGPTASGFTDFPEVMRRIKVINETHFIWVQYDTLSRKVGSSAGGSYTVVGNTYTESLDFGLAMDGYLKRSPAFTIKIEGDMLFQSGLLTPDYKIEEIWKRVK
jgi:hypothetical protein